MPATYSPARARFGLLPEPEGRSASFVTSAAINSICLALFIVIGMMARQGIVEHKYEQTELIIPNTPPPEKVKVPPPPKLPPPPKAPDVTLEAPKIHMPKPEPKPETKPIQIEAKVTLPTVKTVQPKVIEAPQPRVAVVVAPPALTPQAKPDMKQVHLGDLHGVTPNPNATRPATVMAAGNPYGGMQGPAVVPKGVVGGTGMGASPSDIKSGYTIGKVARAGIPATTSTAPTGSIGKVAPAAIPLPAPAVKPQAPAPVTVASTLAEVSIPKPAYTDEARHLKIEGTVVLRVTFFANGQIQVLGVLRGLGHGLDEQAKRAVQQGRVIRPATVNGKPIDSTSNIEVTFQLA